MSNKEEEQSDQNQLAAGKSDTTKLIKGLTHLLRGLKSARNLFRVPELLTMTS